MLLAKIFFLSRSRCKIAHDEISASSANKNRKGEADDKLRQRELVVRVSLSLVLASHKGQTVYFEFVLVTIFPVRSAVSHAEAHIPTQPSSPL
jgi:hypothetical protein